MNSESATRPSLRQLLHELLCDQAAALTVLSVATGLCGWYIVVAGVRLGEDLLTTIGGLGLATPCVIWWVLREPNPRSDMSTSQPNRPPRGSGDPDDIGRMSDEEFDRLLDEVERQGRMPFPPPSPIAARAHADEDGFAQIVREALDELPHFVQDELRHGNLAVVVSDYGREWHAYGLYCGGTLSDDGCHHVITIFRDTLTAQFGDDPDELRRQVKITVCHEVAHHFGADERRVRELGL